MNRKVMAARPLKQLVKYRFDNNGSLRRIEPKPFADIKSGRQRKKAIKANRRAMKELVA